MMNLILSVVSIALGVVFVRFLPFVLFNDDKPIPKYIGYLSAVLSISIIPILIIYSLKSIKIVKYPYGIPEFLCLLLAYVLYKIQKNALVTIFGSTIVYMILVQVIFK